MNRVKFLLPAAVLLLFFPGVASAHNPGGFMLASLVVFITAAGLGVFVKRKLATALFKVKDTPGVGAYIGVAVLEVVAMVFSFFAAAEVSPSKHTLAVLLVGDLLYLLPAAILNFYLVRTAAARVAKAFLYAFIFPIATFVSAFLLFVPLYTIFE